MGRLFFRREDHLVASRDFEALKASRDKIHTPHFIVITRPSPTGRSRLGITASTRIGNAVGRNRVKRLLREFFRLHKEKFPTPMDISVIAKKGSVDLEYSDVCREIGERLLPPRP